VTTLAPVPGRDTPDTSPTDDAASGPAVETVGTPETGDIIHQSPRPAAGDHSALASWLVGLVLAHLSEGTAERVIMAEVLAESAGRSRAIEGAYGRGVALMSEFPGDPLVHRTVDLLAKALLRSKRPARPAEEA
jgi:hypothetical protein